MLSDYERQMCRDHKKRMDAAQTPAGQIAVKMAQVERREREHRADILKRYTEPVAPPDLSKRQEPINPILKQYIDN